jgi:predicted alternative tryptophan synthase beta-subunit
MSEKQSIPERDANIINHLAEEYIQKHNTPETSSPVQEVTLNDILSELKIQTEILKEIRKDQQEKKVL